MKLKNYKILLILILNLFFKDIKGFCIHNESRYEISVHVFIGSKGWGEDNPDFYLKPNEIFNLCDERFHKYFDFSKSNYFNLAFYILGRDDKGKLSYEKREGWFPKMSFKKDGHIVIKNINQPVQENLVIMNNKDPLCPSEHIKFLYWDEGIVVRNCLTALMNQDLIKIITDYL